LKLAPRTPGVHHVALRSADLPRSRRFYLEVLGFPAILESPNLFLFAAGATVFAVKGPEKDSPGGDRFDPFRVGLDHVALACPEEAELRRVAAGLEAAGVPNTGVKLDEGLGRLYVAFKDPDGIAWEVYMARRSAIEAAEACVRALGDRDPGRAPLAADVTLEGPLVPSRVEGREAVVEALRQVLGAVRGARVASCLGEGDEVACRFDLQTTNGVVPAFAWFRATDGRIREIRPFLDPRRLDGDGP